jgi:hypothetical protein
MKKNKPTLVDTNVDPLNEMSSLDWVHFFEHVVDNTQRMVEAQELRVMRLRAFEEPVSYRTLVTTRAEVLKPAEEHLTQLRKFHRMATFICNEVNARHIDEDASGLAAFIRSRYAGK